MPEKRKTKPIQQESQNVENSALPSNGRSRVVITNIAPVVDCGAFAAKTVVDEATTISADIFTDGHDQISAEAVIKYQNEDWQHLPLQQMGNDRWEVVFYPEKTGTIQFGVRAWIDHFASWHRDFLIKRNSGMDTATDLAIGVEMIQKAADSASNPVKKQLAAKAEALQSDPGLVSDPELESLMAAHAPREFISESQMDFRILVERRKALYSTWYELFPRSAGTAGKHGTFKDVEKLLPQIAAMGFDVLYFPPIHPIGEQKRKGRNNSLTAGENDPGSPWAIGSSAGGHKAIHPQLGTLADFKNLLRKAETHGIELALDLAFQCAPDHPYVKEHPEWFKWRPDGTVQYAENPPKKYEDILPINFESPDWENLWIELHSVIMYWIEQGVTIFRVDNPHTKAFPFWQWAIGRVKETHPDVMFLAEAFTRPRLMEQLAKIGFTQSYTYFTWRNTKYELEEYIRDLTQTDLQYYFRPNFWPNTPDILTDYLVHGGEAAHIIRLILAATISSNYGVYGPVYEFGINKPHPGKEEYTDNEKYQLYSWDWKRYTRIKDYMARLNEIRRSNRALQSTANIYPAATSNDQLLAFAKYDSRSGNIILVVVNLDPWNQHDGQVQVPFWKLNLSGDRPYEVHDLLSGEKYYWQSEWNYVKLNPQQAPAHVFKVTQSFQ